METNRPLLGKRIINTRARTQASKLTEMLEDLGAEVCELPTIEIQYVDETSELYQSLDFLETFDWILFTSANGVISFFSLFNKKKLPQAVLNGIKIATIGPGTNKELRKHSLAPTVTAKKAVAESLVESLQGSDSWGKKRILFPVAEKHRPIIPEALQSWGADSTVVTAYRTIVPETFDKRLLIPILENDYEVITFTSSSTVINLISMIGLDIFNRIKSSIKAASIGSITTATLKKNGITPIIEASQSSIPSFVNSIQDYFQFLKL